MVSTDYINGAESESITSQLQQMSRIYDGRILLIDSSFHIIKDTYDLDTDKTIISEEVISNALNPKRSLIYVRIASVSSV